MQDFQDAVRRFQDEHGLRLPPELAALDLVSEVGELAKEVLLSTSYGTKARTPTSNLEAELGDVCYSLASLANSLGLDDTRSFEGWDRRLAGPNRPEVGPTHSSKLLASSTRPGPDRASRRLTRMIPGQRWACWVSSDSSSGCCHLRHVPRPSNRQAGDYGLIVRATTRPV